MKLEYASELLDGNEINHNEIFFISDIESFTPKVKNYLLEKINKENSKAVVFVGDILSGFGTSNRFYKIFDLHYEIFEIFYNIKKIMKKYSKKGIDKQDVAKTYIGSEISDKLSKKYSKEIRSFKSFIRICYKKKIPVVLFSGNHDSLFAPSNRYNREFFPILDEIASLKGLIIPSDFEPIKLNKDLFLMGVHTEEDILGSYNFPQINRILETLNEAIETPEKIIFVSHIPGIEKFSKLGSKDISNLKKRFKFKYHYHGHCKDYHGEYLEEGVPTKSIHIEENDDNKNEKTKTKN